MFVFGCSSLSTKVIMKHALFPNSQQDLDTLTILLDSTFPRVDITVPARYKCAYETRPNIVTVARRLYTFCYVPCAEL